MAMTCLCAGLRHSGTPIRHILRVPPSIFLNPRMCFSRVLPAPTKAVPFKTKETLSTQVLHYLRSSPFYETSGVSLNLQVPVESSDDVNKAFYSLIKVAHDHSPSRDDILQLFSNFLKSKSGAVQVASNQRKMLAAVTDKLPPCISQMNNTELEELAKSIKALQDLNIGLVKKAQHFLVEECVMRAPNCSLKELLHLFDVLYLIYEHNVYRRDCYDTFVELFGRLVDSATPHEVVQMVHYTGLSKTKKFSVNVMEQLIPNLMDKAEYLSFQDIGIAISAIFKSNMKFSRDDPLIEFAANKLVTRLELETPFSAIESLGFVSCIKLIRKAQHYDDSLMKIMTNYILHSNAKELSPQVLSHCMAFFSSSRVYDSNLYCKFESILIDHLDNDASQFRIRDIAKCLWSLSYVVHCCTSDFYDKIIENLHHKLRTGEAQSFPGHFGDSLLSLIILGHYSDQLMKAITDPSFIGILQGTKNTKQLSQMLLIRECIKYEKPEYPLPSLSQASVENVPRRTVTDEVFHRPVVAEVGKSLDWINSKVGGKLVLWKFLIPYINYVNLTIEPNFVDGVNSDECEVNIKKFLTNLKDNKVAVEILDEATCLPMSTRPIGLVNLKMRLLEGQGWTVLKLTEAEVNVYKGDSSALAAYIFDKITNSVCDQQ
ncbi:uncharacterized protein LOC143027654 [Oratosquilla oratoria]|uniref:uncharacterized protein LOC143027654 n=1 Tax=Oratosquilla oratoria TaxID=337810 RepID=UPI003F774D90